MHYKYFMIGSKDQHTFQKEIIFLTRVFNLHLHACIIFFDLEEHAFKRMLTETSKNMFYVFSIGKVCEYYSVYV